MKGTKRTITLRIVGEQEIKYDNVLQYQFFNQGTAEAQIGDGPLSSAAMLTSLESREGLALGNPTFPENLHKAVKFGATGTKELMVYVEVFYPAHEEPGRSSC